MSAESVSVVAGRNMQAIRQRAGLTLAEVAKAARFYGLAWTTGRASAFEAGRVSPTLPTLLAVANTLGDLTEGPVRLADLFAGEGRVEITETLTLDLAKVREALTGAPVTSTAGDRPGGVDEVVAAAIRAAERMGEDLGEVRPNATRAEAERASRLLADFADADFKAAKSLGVGRLAAALGMSELWGKTFVAERDQRAGINANAQRKGRVARELKDELRGWISGND